MRFTSPRSGPLNHLSRQHRDNGLAHAVIDNREATDVFGRDPPSRQAVGLAVDKLSLVRLDLLHDLGEQVLVQPDTMPFAGTSLGVINLGFLLGR